MLTQLLLQPKAYIDGPAGGPYMASKQTLRLLTSQSLQASFIVIVLLSSSTTNRLHWWDKKLGFFMSRVHSSSLPLALDNAYMCAVRCLPLLVFKVYGDSDRRKTEEICLSWFCRVLVRSNDKLEFKKSTIYAQFIHNHHYYKDKWIISKERSKDDTRCN